MLLSGGDFLMIYPENDSVRTVSYPARGGAIRRIAGFALIVLGILLICLCVPFWAWWALLGAALILLGLTLLRNC